MEVRESNVWRIESLLVRFGRRVVGDEIREVGGGKLGRVSLSYVKKCEFFFVSKEEFLVILNSVLDL